MEDVLKLFALTPYDFTMILVFVVIFFVFWQLVARTLFRPYIKLFEAREAATTAVEGVAKDKIAEAQDISTQYEEKVMNARVAAMQEKLTKLNAANAQGTEIISKAENEARDFITGARKDISASVDTLKEECFKDSDVMTNEIVDMLKKPLEQEQRQ